MDAAITLIIFFIGLFTAISLNIYFKYKSKNKLPESLPLESLGEFYKAQAYAKALSRRSSTLYLGGLFAGLGIGVALGCLLVSCGVVTNIDYSITTARGSYVYHSYLAATFFIIGLAIFCGGAGMIGAWFLERKLSRAANRGGEER